MKQSLIIFIFLYPLSIFTQQTSDIFIYSIKLEAIHSHFVLNINYSESDLNALSEKLKTHEPCPYDLRDLLQNINLNFISYGFHYDWYKRNIIKNFRTSSLATALDEKDLSILYHNPVLVSMIAGNMVLPYYPFELKLNHINFDELALLDIHDGDVVGEYGINFGMFAINLGMRQPDVKFKVMLPNQYAIQHTHRVLGVVKNLITQENYTVFQIPELKDITDDHLVDKLVVKDVFQHLNGQEKLINYLGELINPEGYLYLYNYFGDEGNPDCDIHLDVEKAINAFTQEGFALKSSRDYNGYYLMAFQRTAAAK